MFGGREARVLFHHHYTKVTLRRLRGTFQIEARGAFIEADVSFRDRLVS